MDIFITNLLAVGFIAAVAVASRGFWLWYTRMDKLIHLLEQIEHNTRTLSAARTIDLKKGMPRVFGRKPKMLILKKFENIGFTA